MVKARGGTVIFETLKPLIGLLQGVEGIDELIEYSADNSLSVEFDFYASLMDMPNIFGTTVETIPTEVPYVFAGAMAKPTWAVLCFLPSWRYILGRQDCPWYPTMRLFRQRKSGDWNDVFECLAEQLQILTGKQAIGAYR